MNEDLYKDARGAGVRPKNFHLMRPDLLGPDFGFEIKGNVSGKEWDKLSRNATNDHIRFALLRMGSGAAADGRREFGSLDVREREIVSRALRPWPRSLPASRLYVRWDDIKKAVRSPDDNLELTTLADLALGQDRLELRNIELPIKRIGGVRTKEYRAIYVLDSDTMTKWERILGRFAPGPAPSGTRRPARSTTTPFER
jgi:hypothetical protein